MRPVRLAVGLVLAALVATLATVTPNPASAGPPAAASAASTASAERPGTPWSPPAGVVFSNPLSKNSRVILRRLIDTIYHARRGSTIRIATWNFDDYPTRLALIRAFKRGANVQVVVAGSVHTRNFRAVASVLNRRKGDPSFARRCTGGCRSYSKIMHSKIYLFDRIGDRRDISMFGSANLTTPAGNRQWNDMVTSYSPALYRFLEKTFIQYSRDRAVRPSYARSDLPGGIRVWLWPSAGQNSILQELRMVRCHGALGTPGGRTKIRIAVAGWFDAFGNAIARRVRTLWNQGCDVKIVTTLAGRGVNGALKGGYGRGPVPINRIGTDPNKDGVPDKYLHMKAVAIKGVFGGNRRARVVITGSPNWSSRASRSEEVLIRLSMKRSGMVDAYINHVNRLYSGPAAYARALPRGGTATTTADADGAALRDRYVDGDLPDWFELD